MLSGKFRFHGHGSLNYLFRNGKTARSSWLLLRSVENKRRTTSRVAIIVGKKVAKSAVVRNRIRRRVYEIVRRHWGAVPFHTDLAITVLSAEVAVAAPEEIEKAVVGVLRKAGLYQPGS